MEAKAEFGKEVKVTHITWETGCLVFCGLGNVLVLSVFRYDYGLFVLIHQGPVALFNVSVP